MYLEPIFGRGALPKEQGRFKRVDDDYRYVFDLQIIIIVIHDWLTVKQIIMVLDFLVFWVKYIFIKIHGMH